MAIFILAVLWVIGYIIFVMMPFVDGRSYLKKKIIYAFDDAERERWRRELKMLYLSSAPVVRFFFRKKRK